MSDPGTRIRALLDELAHETSLDPALERPTLRRARRHRLLNAAAVAVVAVAVVSLGAFGVRQLTTTSVPADRGTGPSVAEAPNCTGQMLQGRVASQSGAAGTIRTVWELTNVSDIACRTSDHPTVSFQINRWYTQWFTPSAADGGYPDISGAPSRLLVEPGDAAWVITYWSDVTTGIGPCVRFDRVAIGFVTGLQLGSPEGVEVPTKGCVVATHLPPAVVHVGPFLATPPAS